LETGEDRQVKREREKGRGRRRAPWLLWSFARSCLVLLVLLRALELLLLLLLLLFRLGTNAGLLSFLFVSVRFSRGFCFVLFLFHL
jgi:hypothetical protein